MKTEIVFCDDQSADYTFDRERLKKIIEECLRYEGVDFDCEIGVTFVDDVQIKELNRVHRGIDKKTDVLSFPMLDDVKNISEFDINPDDGDVLLGDIVISLETAQAQSVEYGHSFEREVAFLIVHSMMHLLGYDHIEDEDRVVMREHEEAVLSKMGITRGEN